ncbi:hypothetical protein ACQ86I_17875 [Prescottella equi]
MTVVGSTGGNSTNPATVAARGGSTATGVDPTGRALPQGVASPAPFSEAAPAPTADNPAPGETPTQPVYTPPPAAGGGTAPAPVQGPSPRRSAPDSVMPQRESATVSARS